MGVLLETYLECFVVTWWWAIPVLIVKRDCIETSGQIETRGSLRSNTSLERNRACRNHSDVDTVVVNRTVVLGKF